ncbi:hypothetical protein [Prevotella corporis]|uniref:hypothetical protein n=1 Tax=Prevotella corporis TaxID=28128 RepID=UPI003B67133C
MDFEVWETLSEATNLLDVTLGDSKRTSSSSPSLNVWPLLESMVIIPARVFILVGKE